LRIVLDTNVLVSGLLSPFGPPGEIVRLASNGYITLCVDARISAEYRDVLARPRFGFNPAAIAVLLDYLESNADVVAAQPLVVRLPDADDEPFLEVALATGADCLATGNLAHFPPDARAGVTVVTPAELVELYRRRLADLTSGSLEPD
jgi:putative PIN family toxin of toxin-antitoxin system